MKYNISQNSEYVHHTFPTGRVRPAVNLESEGICIEVAVADLSLVSQNVPGTENIHENCRVFLEQNWKGVFFGVH